MAALEIPDWVTYPEDEWIRIEPEEAGLNAAKFGEFIAGLDVRGASFGGEEHSRNQHGAVLTRGGYLIQSWGDPDYRFQTASTGKALSWPLIGFAAEEGLLDPDEPVNAIWTGEGELSHPHKHLSEGHHKTLTWRHLIGRKNEPGHLGGFPMELGVRWSERRTGLEDADAVPGVPEWASWTGDPFYDCYSHAEPGTQVHYSSAGFWRLSQALTQVWDRDLKEVIDERIFSKIGIPADRWDWLHGEDVKNDKFFYPEIPDSYTYLDPPYEANGHRVRSGPGWVVISAADWARYGLLLATQGVWKGERIVDSQWLRGHGGGNKSGVSGESTYFTSMGVVATQGLDHQHAVATDSFIPEDAFGGPVQV